MHPSLLRRCQTMKCHLTQSGGGTLMGCSSIRSVASNVTELNVGDIIHGYKVERVDHIKELNIRPYLLRHQATGAEHLHIRKDEDSNNVFAVILKTTPKNSTGVAHVLEHITLSGSQKYNVRDAFFSMLSRSLATFINAMTGPDITLYPFSTQNKKDFENLLSVYIDSVFFPKLKRIAFCREAWRLEHEVPDKKETPIVIKGVVFNEMKGTFSSSNSIYARSLLNNIFPDTIYQHESGGDPLCIPDLTHEEMKKFHQTHYHPSNAKFFTYGNMPLEDHLQFINQTLLSKFSENPQAREQSVVELQEPWNEPKTVEITCPIDPLCADKSKQITTSVTYMLPIEITQLDDVFALQILSKLLTSGSNAPFHKKLLESGLGADYSPRTGAECSIRQPCFSIGLKNVHQDDVEKVHSIIDSVLKEVAENGFSQDRIEAVLHSVELSIKHISGSFGMRLIMNVSSSWIHDSNIIEELKINSQVNRFREALRSDPQYWKKLIEKYFLSNKHKLILNMRPDEQFEEKRKAAEAKVIQDKVSKLDEAGLQTILYEGMEMKKLLAVKEDKSALPSLKPSEDISKELIYKDNLKFDSHRGVNIQLCEQPTNELVYFRGLVDITEKLDDDLLDYLPLFCDVAAEFGAGRHNRQEFDQLTQLYTSGLKVSMLLNPDLKEFDKFTKEVLITSSCLKRNIPKMFELWTELYRRIDFESDKDYLTQLVKATASDLVDSIPYSGNSYAAKRASSSLSKLAALDERLSGLTYVNRMKKIASDEPIEHVVGKLQRLARLVFDPSSLKCSMTTEPEIMNSAVGELKKFIDSTSEEFANYKPELKSTDANKQQEQQEANKSPEEVKFPFATHFVAKSIVTVPKRHKDYAKLMVMAQLVTHKYLLKEVRERGGAYGSSVHQSITGILSFSSYRDPNTSETMRVFDNTINWVNARNSYDEEDVEEAKLSVFQKIDKPVEPGRRGLDYFIHGESEEELESFRRALLEVTKSDIQKAASEHLIGIGVGTYII